MINVNYICKITIITIMDLTVADLAQAVGRSENYIRQHIHRKHLIARRDGRRVSVALDDATRWARERGLPFVSPTHAVTTGAMERRTARMTVLSCQGPSTQPINLFTLIRHRRRDALGPWANQPDETWTHDNLGAHGLRLFTFDASLERCRALVDRIKDSGKLLIDGKEVGYSLAPVPRRHWAYRDAIRRGHDSVQSPFARHSAEIIEYWSFEQQPRKLWRDVLASPELRPRLARLGFPLDGRSDRIGNLMIAGTADEVRCDLRWHRDRTLRLHVDTNDMPPTAYRTIVWASHSGDEVLRQEFRVTGTYTLIELGSDVDRIGFAIYRITDGQCVESKDAVLLKDISVHMHLDSRPTLHLYNRIGRPVHHKVTPRGSGTMINVNLDEDSDSIDNEIRRLSLDCRIYDREEAARREGNLVRFSPSDFDQAALHFIDLLRHDSHQVAPIYIADPYFLNNLEDDLIRLYLDVFAATADRPLSILCGTIDEGIAPWWSGLPRVLTSHVTVRSFTEISDLGPKPGFHDRYLITPDREILITNSFNGWSKRGVTFASLPYGIYRAEALQLWGMEEGSTSTPLCVQELA